MYTEIHNTIEDIVFSQIALICDSMEKEQSSGICTCDQCMRDTACYVLNRIPPRYVISNRGVARAEQETIERQQQDADIIAMIHEGIRRVNHNQRPYVDHQKKAAASGQPNHVPVFNVPAIVGRLYNGINFEPMSEIVVELRRQGELVQMKNENWQNPFHLVLNTGGTFAFWPAPIPAEGADIHRIFEYSIRIEAPGFEILNHFMKIPVLSELNEASSYSMARTFKLPDLYMFPPGSEEDE